jgi:hypothetical protein
MSLAALDMSWVLVDCQTTRSHNSEQHSMKLCSCENNQSPKQAIGFCTGQSLMKYLWSQSTARISMCELT